MTAGFVCAAYVCVGVLTLFFFLLRSPPPAWIRGRRKEPPSVEVRLPPTSLPAALMVGLWGTGYKGGKEAKMKRKGFDLFYLTVSNWIQELWGTGVKINSSWSAFDGGTESKDSLWTRGSPTPCPSLLFSSFFSSRSLHLGFLCFISGTRQDGNGEGVQFFPSCTSHWVYWSLNVRMLKIIWPEKCGSIGNPLEGQYPGTRSISLSSLLPVPNAIPCLCCQNILFQFSALRLPNSCHRQLDSVDVAKASLPAHYPTPCHAPSLPSPSRHKLIGLNPVINRLEKQLSMFVSLPKAELFGHGSPPLFSSPSVLPTHNSNMPSPPFLFGFPC